MRLMNWHFSTFILSSLLQKLESLFITNAIQSNFDKLPFAKCFNINLNKRQRRIHRGFCSNHQQITFYFHLISTKLKQNRNQSRFGTVMKVIEWNIKQQETWTLFRPFTIPRVSILIDTKAARRRKTKITHKHKLFIS